MIDTGVYGYKVVNVAVEKKDAQSLLRFVGAIIKLRKQYPEIDNGEWKILDNEAKNVLAIQYSDKDKSIVTVHNFSSKPQNISLPNNQTIKLGGYGFKWLRLN